MSAEAVGLQRSPDCLECHTDTHCICRWQRQSRIFTVFEMKISTYPTSLHSVAGLLDCPFLQYSTSHRFGSQYRACRLTQRDYSVQKNNNFVLVLVFQRLLLSCLKRWMVRHKKQFLPVTTHNIGVSGLIRGKSTPKGDFWPLLVIHALIN